MTDPAKGPSGASAARYSTVAILLHWTIALAIVLQIILSGRMDGPHTPETFAVTQLHKSIGISILLLSLVRLGWRLINPPPPEPAALAPWERRLSAATHWSFYVIMIAKLIYVLLALHVAGALKHQLFSRNEPVLSRMAPGAVSGRWLEPRVFVIAAALLGVIAFGRLVQPPRPAAGPPPAPTVEPIQV